jgi:hypothetical protein
MLSMTVVSARCIEDQIQPADVGSVLAAMKRAGTASVVAPDGSAWVCAERGGVSRYPLLPRSAPSEEVCRALFRTSGTWILDYLEPADEHTPANASLYLFRGPEYSLDALSKNGRRDARKALRELEIGWITHDQLLAHGFEAYADCRTRVGLSDGTLDHFRNRFGALAAIPGHHYLGAWKEDKLAAFMTIHAVEGCASIAAYAHWQYRGSCPNDGLIHFALHHCVNERGIGLMSYGLSSVQEETKAASLHEFKLKAGFQAEPVHRAFRVHPRAAPIVNRGTLAMLHLGLKLAPKNRVLKKASGVVAQILASRSSDEGSIHDAA